MAISENYPLFIGGDWIDKKEKFDVINPATEEVIVQVPNAGPEEMKQAIEAAVRVQPEWADTVASERARILADAAKLMRERIEKLAEIMTIEEGKPLAESRGEIGYAASFLEWFAEEAKRIYGDTIPSNSKDKRILVIKRPVGVTAAITPWNFPAAMITRKIAPAFAAGCTMIVKPSELTPLSALEIAKIFEEVGLPKGVLSIVAGTEPAALTRVLMDDVRVRKISFTGSTPVGKLLMKQAADTMKRVSFELGGHAPFIVFQDADLDEAVSHAVLAKMRGMGEACVAANRFYVQEEVLESFTEKLASRLQAMKVGNGLQEGVSVGPLIEPAAVQKVEDHVQDAVAKGAKLVLGGERSGQNKGYYYPPTLLTNVNEDMKVTFEETFGPVAAILPFSTEEEVIQKANNTRYGLAAYFFTRDVGRLFRLADRLEYGILGANDGLPSTAQAPFGGIKESGLGREGSKYGIEEYLDIKYISIGGISR
ncbi:NAD-dependent succinate-semialdehyde dehydrogenase [Aneurinibacillus sp. Ricciae_BoGa-3]|uniref:NAD-dependent succinate-semialdehyde dehydrogenase n=1 Tax=Aneurinibacillus sp. Ricciae_BoGa-3 TaxID=3022697 RepID=UPI00233F9C9F|nr:NAD-dependent succinate-semialdehyde dehydrogenase [Aneurinibacillus sp. Ricciae_BoGa-3]WCK52606.1 NAD-dependent succinate-semialdehyde dehydrogenase [Aneurinibacillus sp. Ricciae_BoGa-3]